METRTPLAYFLNGDKIGIIKIILSLCLGNIFDGDKIPIAMFFEWGQDSNIENYFVSMLSKYFLWRQDPHCNIFFNGDKIVILKIILSPCFVNIFEGDKIPIAIFL